LAKGDVADAIADFEKVISLSAKNPMGYFRRGAARGRLGDFEGSAADYKRAAELDGRFTNARPDGQPIKREKSVLEIALTDATHAVDLNPKSAAAYLNRGNVERDKRDLDAAIADYTQAIQLDSKLANAYFNRGLVHRQKGNLDAAIADYDQVITAQNVPNLDPTRAAAYNSRGAAKQTKGDVKGAVTDYDRAIELNPKLAIAYHNRGYIKQDIQHDSDGAMADYNRAIELDPKFAQTYFNRANIKQRTGDLDGAMADRNRGIELKTEAGAGNGANLPEAQMAQVGRSFAANLSQQSATKHVPILPPLETLKSDSVSPRTLTKTPELLAIEAEAAWRSREFDRCIEASTGAMPGISGERMATVLMCRGSAYLEKGDSDNALHDFDEAAALNPKLLGAYVKRAVAYAWKKENSKAREQLNLILQLQIKPPESILNSVAWIRATCREDVLRDGTKAVEESVKACELTQWSNWRYLDTLAAAYAEEGDFDQAIKYEQQSVDTAAGSDPQRAQMQQRLALYREHKPFREEPAER
jgi:tetratricopeptide (TPR) repeat protein